MGAWFRLVSLFFFLLSKTFECESGLRAEHLRGITFFGVMRRIKQEGNINAVERVYALLWDFGRIFFFGVEICIILRRSNSIRYFKWEQI